LVRLFRSRDPVSQWCFGMADRSIRATKHPNPQSSDEKAMRADLEAGKSRPRRRRQPWRACEPYAAARCGTCDRFICERHQVACVVDGSPHCSKRLSLSPVRRWRCCEHLATVADVSGAFASVSEYSMVRVRARAMFGGRTHNSALARCVSSVQSRPYDVNGTASRPRVR
jgi:hypothetical protein